MPRPIVREQEVWEGADFDVLDRLVNGAGTVLDSDDVPTYSFRIYPKNFKSAGKKINEGSSTTGIVTDALATTHGWSRDTIGWNVKRRFLASEFTLRGGVNYTFEFIYHTTADGDIPIVWTIRVKELRGA